MYRVLFFSFRILLLIYDFIVSRNNLVVNLYVLGIK